MTADLAALAMAEHYARDLGWRVVPLAPASKRPATTNGYHDATRDLATIRAWWRREPRYGIGVACEGIVVVDVDVRGGKPGRESLAALEREHGPLPGTWTVITPSGGEHRYYATARHVARAIGVRPGLDLLGVGGYVVAPPTETHEGAYRWTGDDVGLAQLPTWLAELSRPAPVAEVPTTRPTRERWTSDVERRAARALAYVDRMPVAIAGSGGHDAAYRVALALVRGFSLPLSVAREILAYYSARCTPPWSEQEREHKLRSAASARVADGYLLGGRP